MSRETVDELVEPLSRRLPLAESRIDRFRFLGLPVYAKSDGRVFKIDRPSDDAPRSSP